MLCSFQSGRIVVRLAIFVVICGVLVGGGLTARKYVKQSAARKALVTGKEAYAAKRYTDAAVDLGRYLTVDRTNVDVLLMYADAQIRRRPQARSNFQQAVNALEMILRAQPGHRIAAERLLDVYTAVKADQEAERISRAWLAAAGSDQAARSAARQRLLAALTAQQKWDDVEKNVTEWLAEAPNDAAAMQSQAQVLFTRQKTDDAIKVLQAAVEQHPAQIESARRLAVLLAFEKKNRAAAEKVLADMVTRNPESAEARLARGQIYLAGLPAANPPDPAQASKDRAQVVEDFEEAGKLAADKASILLNLGVLYSEMGMVDKATAVFDRAEKAAPSDPSVYAVRMELALDSGDAASSAALADRVLAAPLGEQRLDILPAATELCATSNRIAQARKLIDELQAAKATPEVLLYLEAVIDVGEGRLPEGVVKLQDVVRRNPKLARAQLLLGRSFVRTGELRRALEPLRAFVSLSQADRRSAIAVRVQLELAQVYARLGQWDEAVRVARDINLRIPNAQVASTAFLARLELEAQAARQAKAKPDLQRLAELQTTVERLIQQNPEVVEFQILKARLLGYQQRVAEAAAVLNALKADSAGKLQAALALMDLYADSGRFDQAVRECAAAMELIDNSRKPALQVRLAELQASAGNLPAARRLLKDLPAGASEAERLSARAQLARILLQNNQVDDARTELLQLVQDDTGNIPARVLLLGMKPAEDQKPSPQELVDQIKKIEGEKGQTWRYWQAAVWLADGKWESHRAEAEKLINESLSEDSSWDAGALVLGAWYERAGETDRALEVYRRQFNQNRADLEVARRLLALAANRQRWAEVERTLDMLPIDEPSIQKFRLALLLQSGERGLAGQMLEKQIQRNPQDYQAYLQLASLRLESNDLTEAERQLSEAIRLNPGAREVLQARVQLHMRRREYEQAIRLCDQSLATRPAAEEYRLRSRVYEAQSDLVRAAEDLRAIASLDGMAERGFLALGQLYLRHDQRDKAIESWREGLKAVPDSYVIQGMVAEALLGSSDPQQRQSGFDLLQDLLKKHPEDEPLLLMQAEHLARSRRWEDAQKAYEDIIGLHPNSVAAYRGLAIVASAQGRRSRALELIERGLSTNPRDIDLLLLRSELLRSSGPERALASAQAAVKLQPSSEPAALALATSLDRIGRRDAAISSLQEFLKPADWGPRGLARFLLARLQIEKGDFAAADRLIEEIGRLIPDSSLAAQARVLWHKEQGQWDLIVALATDQLKKKEGDLLPARVAAQALLASGQPQFRDQGIQLFQKLIGLHPDEATGYFDLGSAYFTIGKPAEARAAWEHGLKLAPDSLGVANDLAWTICEDLKEPQAALEWSRKALAASPDDPHILDTWGVLQYRLGNLKESREALQKCLGMADTPDPTRLSATFHLARTLATVDSQESRRLLRNLLADRRAETLLSAATLREARELNQNLTAESKPAS